MRLGLKEALVLSFIGSVRATTLVESFSLYHFVLGASSDLSVPKH